MLEISPSLVARITQEWLDKEGEAGNIALSVRPVRKCGVTWYHVSLECRGETIWEHEEDIRDGSELVLHGIGIKLLNITPPDG